MFDNLKIILPDSFTIKFIFDWNPKIDLTLRRGKTKLKSPGPITLTILGEKMDNLEVRVNSSFDEDAETRKVTYSVDGGEVKELEYPVSTPQTFIVPQNSTVHLTIQDIDDSGNKSPLVEKDVLVTDTVPPTAPGEPSLEVVSEQ